MNEHKHNTYTRLHKRLAQLRLTVRRMHAQPATNHGAVMLVIMLLLLGASMVMVAGFLSLVQSQVRIMTEQLLGAQVIAFTEGALEDVTYRHIQSMNVDATELLTLGDLTASSDTTVLVEGYEVKTSGSLAGHTRTMTGTIFQGDGVSFRFGVQTSDGGIIMRNSSSITGNVYSNGPILGHNLNDIIGTAISAGPAGHIEEVHTTDHMYANDIEDSHVEDDAYYQTIDVGTVVGGTSYPGATDLATSSLPITEDMLTAWKEYASTTDVMDVECAAAGGTLIIDANMTLGPAKIPCDVEFNNFPVVTIAGVIWIEGNLEFNQGPEFHIDPAIGNRSVPIIVDNPADRLTSSHIVMRNSGSWYGNGSSSYSILISRNESAEQGGSEEAITIEQSTGGALLVYAGHGEVKLQNNTDLTMLTAWRVRLENLTEVHYDDSITATVFDTGPTGMYEIMEWKEIE